jgi:hypothetical protein
MTQSFDPLDFLGLARELGNRNQDEASLRTAVGRAYYALFIIARDKLGFATKKRAVHTLVTKELKKRKGYRSTADQFAALKRLRHAADYQMLPYDPADRDWQNNWSRTESLVNQILRKLQAL